MDSPLKVTLKIDLYKINNMNINTYTVSGYFSSAAVSAMHFQDLLLAFMLGFIGALGGYLFKLVKDYFSK